MCKWIEAGTTIDTALPEIGNLTDDKKEWRAVIVRYIDDNCMAAFESDVRNPYDFLINRDAEDSVEESPIPLVRLTQMLGGVPPLEIKFKAEILREAHKAPRTIYVPIENTQRERAHKELTAKYAFDGKLPSSILIISVRSKSYQAESLGRSWLAHKESESSEFWKRNHFPSICRFMVYDIEKQGPIQKEADDFGFWYSVMLMAINEWDSSTIQAYRLYTLGVFMNSDAMSESFQMLADRLRDAKRSIERSIKKDIEGYACEELGLPDFKVEIPVALKIPKVDECTIKKMSFHLLSDGAATDTAIWEKAQRIAENELNALNRGATIEYYGDLYQMAANNTYYLDTDLAAGSHAIKALCRRVDSSLNKRDGKFSENNLVTLTTILQVRIQSSVTTKMPGLEEYVQKAVNYLELYQTRPQHTSSNKIEFYLNSVLDDFREFLSCDNFDISQCIYDKYRGIKDIKRQQWVCHDIFDPESVSEHLYSAWLMAMLFLPEETKEAGYNKREILDMLLIHDLAEAEIGDQVLSLDEPSKELKTQNAVLRKLFVKGTYPQIANLTYYYNIWTGYYNGTNINARVARDINTIQTSYTFFEYYLRYPDHFSPTEILAWTKNQDKLNTEIVFNKRQISQQHKNYSKRNG